MTALFQVITLFPQMITSLFEQGVVGQAQAKGLFKIETINPRQFAAPGVHQAVDDRPFGGGDGMIMQAEPLHQAWLAAKSRSPAALGIYLSPQGERLGDSKVRSLSQDPNLILICGRYGGVDQRFLVKNQITEISIGDYVLSGGELAAAVLIDAVSRRVPGVLGHADSAQEDSFLEGLLEAPLFTRPREWGGLEVPEVLLSGHHAKMKVWQKQIARLVTLMKRPDLEPFKGLSPKGRSLLTRAWENLTPPERKSLGLDGLSESSLREILSSPTSSNKR